MLQAPAAPPGESPGFVGYPFTDISQGNCTVTVTLGPTHWSDYEQSHHGVLQLVSHCFKESTPPSESTECRRHHLARLSAYIL